MNWKTWVPLMLAVALGLVAMKIARDVVSKGSPAPAAQDATRVVVVKDDLPAGAALHADDLATARMHGQINSSAIFTDPAQLEGRVLITSAIHGTPVLQTMLAPAGSGSGLQALIPAGMRAITVEINEFSGVAGNLVPGCKVDVVASVNGEGGGEMISRTIVQDVKVTAIGMRRATDSESGSGQTQQVKSVTLLTTPKQAEAIELATATGRPRLILRSGNDDKRVETEGVTVGDLRRGVMPAKDPFIPVELIKPPAPTTAPATAAPPMAHTRQITVIRAGVESQTTVEEPAVASGGRWFTGVGTQELSSDPQQ